jgi:hypothetical protein
LCRFFRYWYFQNSLVLNNDAYITKLKTVLGKFEEDQDQFSDVYKRIEENAKWIEKNLPEAEAWLGAESA